MNYNVDPIQLLQMIRNGQNPQQLMLSILERQADTPVGANLLALAKEGKTQEIEQIARNLYAQQGRDFDSEFNAFRQQYKL